MNGKWVFVPLREDISLDLQEICDELTKFTALDRIEVKGDEHERRATGSGTTTEE